MQIKNAVKQALTQRLDRKYERQLARKKITYDVWVKSKERNALRNSKQLTQENSRKDNDFVLIVQSRGKLHEYALQHIKEYFDRHEECLILYGDEDVMGADGVRRSPWYKPCWSPDLYLEYFYPGSVVAVRKTLAERFLSPEGLEEGRICFERPNELREKLDELFLGAGGFERGCRSIARIPEILFHAQDETLWNKYLESVSGIAFEETAAKPLVSVIIPSKDNPEVLQKCLESLGECKAEWDMEIIVVDNGSSEQNRAAVEAVTEGMVYLYHPMEFNFSAMCNMGVEQARGNLLLFLNDDVEVCGTEWLKQMTAKAVLPYVGAVGLKLYYPNSNRIQHAGVFNMFEGPAHMLHYLDDNESYYFGRNRFNHDCVAVTGACLMVEREKYLASGGFPEVLKIGYNDVDLGFSLWEAGYQNVVVNRHSAIHHESLSRGNDDDNWEKQKRLEQERKLLYERHPLFRSWDPYYPEQLNTKGLDSRIHPAYVTAGNTLQQPCWKEFTGKLADYREDECMMVRVDTSGPEIIRGYSIVLWDDNACYDKYLLLESEEDPDRLLYMKLEGQYRYDLENNVPDQKNVALGGYCVIRAGENLAPGSYRIGLLAVHCISSLKLQGWSGKCLRVEERKFESSFQTTY